MNCEPIQIIAEAGVNHNGSLEMAVELVDRAAEAGADWVKFQTFSASKIASIKAVKADYQKRAGQASESQLAMLERLELSRDDHHALIERCDAKGVRFLSSPFDPDSLRFLTGDLALETIKLGSGELTNAELLLAAGRHARRIVLSTGMGTLGEVEEALGVIAFGAMTDEEPQGRADFSRILADPAAWTVLQERVALLHCTTEYPAPDEDTNLAAMDTLATAFRLPIGFSDHTVGLTIGIAAAARGATIIEKHFTLDRALPGPDHAASLEPDELGDFVAQIRRVEKAMGNGAKQPGPAEAKNRPIARKSIVAARDLVAGTVLEASDLAVKRPANGRSPMEKWDIIGTRLERDVAQDDPL